MTTLNMQKANEDEARAYFENLRWPHGPVCPHCGSKEVIRLGGAAAKRGLIHCKGCREQFTVKVGTVFESSHIPLHIWLKAMHYMCASKKGVSALQLSRMLGITYKSAWFMAHRIRYAVQQTPTNKMLSGTVEVDETYVGGKLHGKGNKAGMMNKTPVVALVERHGKIVNFPTKRVTGKTAVGLIKKFVDPSATIMTDESVLYKTPFRYKRSFVEGRLVRTPVQDLAGHFKGGHHRVNHSKYEFARGNAYTNTVESYFALLKRGLHGSFHHVSAKHLHRYCNEFSFRWNTRKHTDAERTAMAGGMIEGKRLTYSQT